jgi:PhnB protein
MAVKPVPEGYHTVTPYLAVDDAKAAIDFYERAFGARERSRMPGPDGKIAHAEIEIGDSIVMLADPFPQSNIRPPKEVGGTTCGAFLYVENIDDFFQRAVDAGATVTMEPEDMFWGDRFGSVTDPYGHAWQIATHVEDVTPEQMAERSQEWMAAMAGAER